MLVFLEESRTPWFAFEIYWPLVKKLWFWTLQCMSWFQIMWAHQLEGATMLYQIKQSNWANFKYCRLKRHNLTQTNMSQKYNLVWLQCMSWFQIMWARQLEGVNTSYQILTIGEATHINDNRFLIHKSTVNNVRRYSHR